MRRVVYGGACSLDGFLSGPGGAIDWLHFSKDVEAVMARSWAGTDAVLFGRKTWEQAGGGGGGSTRRVKSYVFSRTLTTVPRGVELVRDDAGGFVRALKERPGKGILVMSGGNLARSLFEAGVIDEIGLNIHPVLLGTGTPTFLDAGIRIHLALQECRTLDRGCVLVIYRVGRG